MSAWELHAKDEAPRDDTVTLLHSQTPEWVGANALWQIQSPVGLNDGSVLQGQGYRLQHLPSGKYLAVASAAADGKGD